MRVLMILLPALALCASCSDLLGEDEPAAPGPVHVQLDIADDVTVGALTPAQRTETCDALNVAIEQGVPKAELCDIAGLLSAAGKSMEGLDAARAACDEVVDPCRLAARVGASFDTPPLPLECALFRGDTAACESTVADLKICLDHLATATATSLIALSCATLTADGLAEAGETVVGEGVPDDPTCARVAAECPGLFGAGDAPADAGPPEADAGPSPPG